MQGVANGLEFLHHLGRWHEALVVVMAAPLRKCLILEMESCNTGALECARCGLCIERIAVSGIRIGNDRHPDNVDHRGQPIGNGGHGQKTQIGHGGGARDRAAAGIDRRKSRLFDQSSRKPVIGARRHRYPARLQQRS